MHFPGASVVGAAADAAAAADDDDDDFVGFSFFMVNRCTARSIGR